MVVIIVEIVAMDINNRSLAMFKNWKAICEILDTHFMWALALLDLETNFGQSVAKRFPEYFSDQEEAGPIPLSVLRMLAEQDATQQGSHNFDCLVSFGRYWRKKYNIPIISFSIFPDSDLPMLPSEIDDQIDNLGRRAEVGDMFIWEGKPLVLLENNDDQRGSAFVMEFAPAELIAVNR